MLKHAWTVICVQIITDRETGAVSYITALEKAALPDFPIETPPLRIGTAWYTDEPETAWFDVKVLIESPAKKKQKVAEKLGIKTKGRARINFNCCFKAEDPGRHFVIVQYRMEGGKWQTASRAPLDLVRISELQPDEQ